MLPKTLILIAFFWFGGAFGNRVRRHLVFSEGSKLFFSVDIRDNLFSHSDLFANVFGVKMDWDLPSKIVHGTNKGKIQRRDLYQGMGHVLRQQNVNSISCIRRFLCEAFVVLPKSNHFLSQLYEVILSAKDKDVKDVYNLHDSEKQCSKILSTGDDCPLSLKSLFTRSFNIMIN